MNDLENFRCINNLEKKIIYNSLSRISIKILPILENFNLYLSRNDKYSKNNYPLVFLITNENQLTLEIINFKNMVNSAGLYFGFIKKGEFYLSLEGAEFLFTLDCFSKQQKIYINEDGERAILYGNRILKHMIAEIPEGLEKGSFLLVFNLEKELIAIAKSQVSYHTYKNLYAKEIIAINLVDKGYYLRKKQ